MEILEASAPSKIVIKLDFYTPLEAHNAAEFAMLPQRDATSVSWRKQIRIAVSRTRCSAPSAMRRRAGTHAAQVQDGPRISSAPLTRCTASGERQRLYI